MISRSRPSAQSPRFRNRSRNLFRDLFLLVLGALVWFTTGCGGDSAKLVPVKGVVTINGKPLTSGTVQFRPNKAKGNTSTEEPLGLINDQGEFSLETRGKPGAPLGSYKVTVASTGPVTPDNTKVSTQSIINTTYMHADITPLECDVVDKPKPGAYDLKLSP